MAPNFDLVYGNPYLIYFLGSEPKLKTFTFQKRNRVSATMEHAELNLI